MSNSKEQQELDNVSHVIATATSGIIPEGAGMITFVFNVKENGIALSMSSNLNDEAIMPALALCMHTLRSGASSDGTFNAQKVMEVAQDGEVTHYDNDGKPLRKN